MAILPIRMYGDPVLREKARPVAEVSDKLRALARDMRDTMHAYNGVGLAANQVGVLERVVIVSVPLENDQRAEMTLINPKVEERTGSEDSEEGCLSIPGIYENVKRALQVRVTALDEQGRPIDLVVGGYLARAIQHEVDHLDGVLFIDRLSILKRQLLKRPLEALARGETPEGFEPPMSSRGTI